ncbi:hypothetical protein G7Y89_g9724 [Cudoniella acicularis]|uniref:Uncharacterized protein n=1 Tax=Cudoniella acicularis TaxID=354080 RepID=A0A8H4W2A9_9HELO|nr:hypothetical protein G7Y89_g9724 [Cudoniella acicularis]
MINLAVFIAFGLGANLVTANTPIDESVFVNDPLTAVLAAAPLWHFDQKTCFPSSATESNGSQTPSLPNDDCGLFNGGLAAGCPVQAPLTQEEQLSTPFPTYYTIRNCSDGSWRIAYDVFFQKDTGHPYDWEWAIVKFIQNADGQYIRDGIWLEEDGNHPYTNWSSIPSTFDGDADKFQDNNQNRDHPKCYFGKWKHNVALVFNDDFANDCLLAIIEKKDYHSDDYQYYAGDNLLIDTTVPGFAQILIKIRMMILTGTRPIVMFWDKTASICDHQYRPISDEDSLEFQLPVQEKSPTPRPENDRTYRSAFFGLAILYLLTIAAFLAAWISTFSSKQDEEVSTTYFGLPYNQAVVFKPDMNFELPGSSLKNDDPWNNMLPNGRGFVEVPVEPVPDDTSTPEKEVYCISMFHQLHCIAGLKAAFESMSKKSNSRSDLAEPGQNDEHPVEHLMHCFDYLRQAVMCHGDMALEPAVQWKKTKTGLADEWNVSHTCRNYQQLYDFAESHRYINANGTL